MLIALITAGVLGYHWTNGGEPLSRLDVAISAEDFSGSGKVMESPIYISKPNLWRDQSESGRRVHFKNHPELQESTHSKNLGNAVENKPVNNGSKGNFPAESSGGDGAAEEVDQKKGNGPLRLIPGISPVLRPAGMTIEEIRDIEIQKSGNAPRNGQRYPQTGIGSEQNVTIMQVSSENIAVAAVYGKDNRVAITQRGSDRNLVHIAQTASGDSAIINQYGFNNSIMGSELLAFNDGAMIGFAEQRSGSGLTIIQSGDSNHAELAQDFSDARLTQEGDENTLKMYQENSAADILQQGSLHKITIIQFDGMADLKQKGFANSISLRQL